MIEKTTLLISGIDCASCAAIIENTLKKQPGIISANVNLATTKAYCEYDPSKTDNNKIRTTITKLGFHATVESPEYRTTAEYDSFELKKIQATKKLRNTFVFSSILAIPILYFAMGRIFGIPEPAWDPKISILLQFIITTLVMAINYPLYISGFKKLISRNPNMDSLIEIGTIAAYLYSLITASIAWFNPNYPRIHFYFESAVLILVFISLGKYLENLTIGKTNSAIKKLIGLQPKTAILLRDNNEISTTISEVKVGDILLVKPGTKIPVDGIIVEGYAAIDEKSISGESIPVDKQKGDKVIGATINLNGVIKMQATKVGKDTMLAQIVKIVETAIGSKAPIQLLADKISFYFVPIVLLIALTTFILWIILGESFVFALTTFIAILIIACPCALGLATPTAVMMGLGIAAQNGILIKSNKALAMAKKINMVVFDKTGTLTTGKPEVTDILTISEHSINDILQIGASIEKNSEHPLAQAVVDKAIEENIEFLPVSNFKAFPGKGVEGLLNEQRILIGTRNLLEENRIDLSPAATKIANLENQGKTVLMLVKDQSIIGIITVADTLKQHATKAIQMLHQLGKKTVIITGDNRRVGLAIAKQIGIEKVLAEVLPQQKAAEIQKLQQQGNIVAMVGDGINDAPALAQADLGIALGSGTDIAMETGEIILLRDNLQDVIKAIDISSFTFKKIKQNLFWAFFYNCFGILIAAGILYPFTGWLLNPTLAAIAMAFSSVTVVSNSLLMKKSKFAS